MASNKILINIVNGLEGYRLGLTTNRVNRSMDCAKHNTNSLDEERSCLEMLMQTTIVIADEYGYDVSPFKRWYAGYVKDKHRVTYASIE
jgi:hypothetical protein